MTELLKGLPVQTAIHNLLSTDIKLLKDKGIYPTLAVVRVGERPDDVYYEKSILKRAEDAGVSVVPVVLPEDADQEKIEKAIEELNQNDRVHGVLLFRPLPSSIDEYAVCNRLLPQKDIDGITDASAAYVFTGMGTGYPPCTAQASIEILKHYGVELSGKRVVVVGRSLVVGRPVAMMLLKENATVTICHTKTKGMPELCRQADILIVAAGRAGVVDKKYMREGQVIIDVGINPGPDGKMCGDVNGDDALRIAGAYTPVPGGVGTVTTSVLLKHVVAAARRVYEKWLDEQY